MALVNQSAMTITTSRENIYLQEVSNLFASPKVQAGI